MPPKQGIVNQKAIGSNNTYEKNTTHIRWTSEMDRVLIDTLLEQLGLGGKSDSGWKAIAIQAVVQQVYCKLGIVVMKEQVRNRLKTWKQHNQYITEMKASHSGFYWNDSLNMLTAKESVWLEYLKAHPKHVIVRGKMYPYWNEIQYLFGNEQADGSKKRTGIDADTMMIDMDEVSNKTSAVDIAVEVEVEVEVEGHDNAATSSGFAISQPPAKKQKSQGKVSELSETLLTIAEGVKEPVVAYQERETFREAGPTHFIFRIESFSLLSENSIEKYESSEFETGGLKWKLSFYPDGNKSENGNGHISLYLVLVYSASLPVSWELNVSFRLFLFDQIRDRYLIRGDMEGKTSRFHEMKKIQGFPKYVSLAKFKDPSSGYLVDDTCVFGAEVFVYKPIGTIECLSMVKQSTAVTHTWKIENFSMIKEEILYSQNFKAGDHNWNVKMFPKGSSEGKDNSISLYLIYLDGAKEKPSLKVYADFKLRIKDQINGKHEEFCQDKHWFHALALGCGLHKFIGLSEMNDKGKGFLVNDTCIVEVELKVLGKVTKLP